MYALLILLILGPNYQIGTMPNLFPDQKSCLAARYEYEQMLEQTKPDNASYVTRCVDMKTTAAAATLNASQPKADSRI